jgi:acetylornithine deacetylase/succinyl-diaminopimelate desuccinylase-like protein
MDKLSLDVRALADECLPEWLDELGDLVRIPSVSWSSFDAAFIQASAQAVQKLLTDLNFFDSVSIERSLCEDGQTLGNPAVLATKSARNGAPTVLLYAHHDVQPPGDDALWKTPPFEPTKIGNRLFGRGAADDKAGIISHVASLRILQQLRPDSDLGIVVFVEGEEEAGSPSFTNFLRDHADQLKSDIIIVADSGNFTESIPALTVSLRGNVTVNVTVRTLDHAVHSGMFGGAVPDAAMAFIRLISTCYDDAGSLRIEGLTSFDMETPEYMDQTLRSESGLLPESTSIGNGALLSRIWAQPSLTVTGTDMPDLANASNTLLPSVTARLSLRVAPGQSAQEAAEALFAHLRSNAPWGAEVTFSDLATGEGYLADVTGSAAKQMRSAMKAAWAEDPIDIGVGGSIPFIAQFVDQFPSAQVLVTGVEDPDSRAHSPNESLHIQAFAKAIETQALFLLNLDT